MSKPIDLSDFSLSPEVAEFLSETDGYIQNATTGEIYASVLYSDRFVSEQEAVLAFGSLEHFQKELAHRFNLFADFESGELVVLDAEDGFDSISSFRLLVSLEHLTDDPDLLLGIDPETQSIWMIRIDPERRKSLLSLSEGLGGYLELIIPQNLLGEEKRIPTIQAGTKGWEELEVMVESPVEISSKKEVDGWITLTSTGLSIHDFVDPQISTGSIDNGLITVTVVTAIIASLSRRGGPKGRTPLMSANTRPASRPRPHGSRSLHPLEIRYRQRKMSFIGGLARTAEDLSSARRIFPSSLMDFFGEVPTPIPQARVTSQGVMRVASGGAIIPISEIAKAQSGTGGLQTVPTGTTQRVVRISNEPSQNKSDQNPTTGSMNDVAGRPIWDTRFVSPPQVETSSPSAPPSLLPPSPPPYNPYDVMILPSAQPVMEMEAPSADKNQVMRDPLDPEEIDLPSGEEIPEEGIGDPENKEDGVVATGSASQDEEDLFIRAQLVVEADHLAPPGKKLGRFENGIIVYDQAGNRHTVWENRLFLGLQRNRGHRRSPNKGLQVSYDPKHKTFQIAMGGMFPSTHTSAESGVLNLYLHPQVLTGPDGIFINGFAHALIPEKIETPAAKRWGQIRTARGLDHDPWAFGNPLRVDETISDSEAPRLSVASSRQVPDNGGILMTMGSHRQQPLLLETALTLIQIHQDKRNQVKEWVHTLQKRSGEVIDALREEGTRLEGWFICEIDGKPVLLSFMQGAALATGRQKSYQSTMPIQAVHRAFKREVFDKSQPPLTLKPIVDRGHFKDQAGGTMHGIRSVLGASDSVSIQHLIERISADPTPLDQLMNELGLKELTLFSENQENVTVIWQFNRTPETDPNQGDMLSRIFERYGFPIPSFQSKPLTPLVYFENLQE